MSSDPSLVEVLRAAIDARMVDLHVSLPATVLAYDATRQAATVQPLIRRGYMDEFGDRVVEKLPAIPDVPVAFQGAGGFRCTFPVAVGDVVLLIFAEASIDKWLSTGHEGDPRDDRRHTLSDAIAVPGLRSFADPLEDAPTDRMSIGYDGGATIEIYDDEIKLGSAAASSPLALKSDVQAIKTVLTTWTVAPMDGGAALKAKAIADLALIPAGTTKVKGE